MSEAMKPPGLPSDEVAFLKQVLENLPHSTGASKSRTISP
jgi:hypothetical protein